MGEAKGQGQETRHRTDERREEEMSGSSGDSRKRGLQQAGEGEGQGGATKRLHKEGGKAVVEQPGECVAAFAMRCDGGQSVWE